MQDNDGAWLGSMEGGKHSSKIHTALGCIVVGVAFYNETGLLEQGTMVFPAGVGNQHFGVGGDFLQKVCADFQAARAANALHRGHTARFHHLRICAKHQAFDGAVVSGDAVNGQIAACLGGCHHLLFGFLHAFQQRQFAVIVVIHTNAEIDFVGVRIGCKLLVKT